MARILASEAARRKGRGKGVEEEGKGGGREGQGGGEGGRGGQMEGGSETVGARAEVGQLARVEGAGGRRGGRSRKKTEHFQFEAGHTLFSASTSKYQVFTC